VLSLVGILAVGSFLGMRHATDPDHVVALSTIVTRERGVVRSSLIGLLWGLGHTFSIFVVGSMIILFQIAIPSWLGLSMELGVAIMLILLGLLNLTGVLRSLQHRLMQVSTVGAAFATANRPAVREEVLCTRDLERSKESGASARRTSQLLFLGLTRFSAARAMMIGSVHGLAGSAAVALLVMATIDNPWWAISYLLVFGIGTIAGMVLITAAIAMPLAFSGSQFSGWSRGMTLASGALSLCFGAFLFYQIGVVHGLLTAHPQWTPN